MNQLTKKQHYIWRNYLAPWTNDNSVTGQIICFRNNKLFSTSLINIAHENYFYGITELSEQEKFLIYEMFIKNTQGERRKIREKMLEMFCMPYDTLNVVTLYNYLLTGINKSAEIQNNPVFREWSTEHIEILHGVIESTGVPYIKTLQSNDLGFWKDENSREKFSFYLATQYLRTKNMRDKLVQVFEFAKNSNYFSEIHPKNLWIPTALICSPDLGLYIANELSAVLLRTDDTPFIVGDQPVINTLATYDIFTQPNGFEAYYPITPHSALLLTNSTNYVNCSIVSISADEARKYNLLEQKASYECLFAKERAHLQEYVPKQVL